MTISFLDEYAQGLKQLDAHLAGPEYDEVRAWIQSERARDTTSDSANLEERVVEKFKHIDSSVLLYLVRQA
jgi:hypothetical protein